MSEWNVIHENCHTKHSVFTERETGGDGRKNGVRILWDNRQVGRAKLADRVHPVVTHVRCNSYVWPPLLPSLPDASLTFVSRPPGTHTHTHTHTHARALLSHTHAFLRAQKQGFLEGHPWYFLLRTVQRSANGRKRNGIPKVQPAAILPQIWSYSKTTKINTFWMSL